ncbi:HypC/HybG/HupF family hydrogenase formation chaperone [Gemmatimonadota bacterium]
MCLGIPGKVVELGDDATMPMGIVDFGGVRRETCLVYVSDEVAVGDYVIVHAGFAISKLDQEEATRTLELLREIGQLEEVAPVDDAADESLNPRNQDLS